MEEIKEKRKTENQSGSILVTWLRCKEPTEWSTAHSVYLIFLALLVPTTICFWVNFGVAYAVFAPKPAPTEWDFPLPMAGNLFMLTLVQTLSNYVVSGNLQVLDILNGIIPPLHHKSFISCFWPDVETWPQLHYFFLPTEIILPPSGEPDKSIFLRLQDSIKRALFWVVIAFFMFWPLTVIILAGLYGNDNYNSYSKPEWISAIYGGANAMVFMPINEINTMVYMGRRIMSEEISSADNNSTSTVNPIRNSAIAFTVSPMVSEKGSTVEEKGGDEKYVTAITHDSASDVIISSSIDDSCL